MENDSSRKLCEFAMDLGCNLQGIPWPPSPFFFWEQRFVQSWWKILCFFGKRESLTKTDGADQHGWWRWLVEVLLMLETNLDDLRYMKWTNEQWIKMGSPRFSIIRRISSIASLTPGDRWRGGRSRCEVQLVFKIVAVWFKRQSMWIYDLK